MSDIKRVIKNGRMVLGMLMLLLQSTLVWSAKTPEYYTDPQIYGNRPKPNQEYDLGPIGASGIMARIYKGVAVTVEETRPNTPAHGKFNKGDIIVGVNGVLLKGRNPPVTLGTALTEAEAADGVLNFEVKPGKDAAVKKVTIKIPILGGYSKTFPVNCVKSQKIIKQAAEFYSGRDRLKGENLTKALACLFLLSTGDDKYVPCVKEYISRLRRGDHTWFNGYNGVAVAEYYLRTGDKSVLPLLQYYCDNARDRQAYGIGWNHWGYGVNPGYEAGGGMQHAAGNQVLLTLVLGKMCGVNVDNKTLLGALRHWYRFVGHGAIPIADQRYWHIFRSAGRDGATAAVMQIASRAKGDASIYKQAHEYLSMSALTSWPSRAYNWEVIWHSISGANMLEYNPDLYHQTQQRFRWMYDLHRQASGAFYGHEDHRSLTGTDAGISLALAYTAPLKNLAIQGAPRSKYAKDFTLPEHLWGTEADRVFLTSKHHKDFYKYGKEEEIHIPFWQLPVRLQYSPQDVKGLALNTMLKNVRHARCAVRMGAAKALCMNKQFGELEKLLQDPDPRLRRAALDGINDNRPWFTGPVVGKYALKAEEYTPAMSEAITKSMSDPKEAWFVKDAALQALNHAPIEVIKKNIANILPWTTHEEWWLRESAFMALMGLQKNEKLFLKYLPTLNDMITNEYRHNPRIHMIQCFNDALAKRKNDSLVGRLIVSGFAQAAMESKVLPDVGRNPRSKEGKDNIIQVTLASIKNAPEASADLAEALTNGGRLETFDTPNLIKIVKAADGKIHDRFIGLYPALEKLAPPQKKRLTDLLFNDFRPELIKRLATVDKQSESKLIDMIVELTMLKKQIAGWQSIGAPKPTERIWRHRSFDSLTAKDKRHPRDWERWRTATPPAGMDKWYLPTFDDSQWKSGATPIGVGEFIAAGHGRGWVANPNHFIKNNSAWGDGEFLLARTSFTVADTDLDYDYYRIRLLSFKGYTVYLNGKKITTWTWSAHYPEYRQFMLKDFGGKLKKGTNTLAVYCLAGYAKDKKTEEYHPIAQMDLFIEGLKKSDLTENSRPENVAPLLDLKAPWADPSYRKDIPATIAESRPVSTGWKLWMKHHENRKKWVADRKVDLLMVGDSIVFRWGRNGARVWDEYYAKRNGCNIGSSGDRIQHMLWHFQNGGLDGLKGKNPKLVLVMIGTNNRGKPENKGTDTAYGILAILKEIRMRLPESKILLMGLFPRGRIPTDRGRMRNEEINKIIRTYADNEIVHWLDIGHVFLDEKGGLIKELMPDGLHPGEKGFHAWAEAMEPTIKKLLNE